MSSPVSSATSVVRIQGSFIYPKVPNVPDTKPKETPKSPEQSPTPLPVDVISSIPLNVQLAPESLASLGAPPAGTAEPVTAVGAATSQAMLTPQAAATGEPVNVTVVSPPMPKPNVTKGEGTTLAPTTTEADDEVTKGQRRVNILWEAVQAVIAITVTFAIVYLAIVQTPAETITNAFFLIVGFYFSRTNHSAQGGVGPKPNEPYMGR